MNLRLLVTAFFAAIAIAGCSAKEGYSVDELADKAVADKEAFMGKEVVVHGYVAIISRDFKGKITALNLDFDPHNAIERQLSCTISDDRLPEGLDGKSVTVKGKIANIHSQSYMDLKSIKLDPCQLKH